MQNIKPFCLVYDVKIYPRLFLCKCELTEFSQGVLDIIRGATPGQTILGGLEAVSQIFGESVNKEIVKLLARTSGQVSP